MTFYITQVELTKLTGRERPKAQIRWLIEHGFRPHRRADGLVLVKRDDYEDYMDGQKSQRQDDQGGPEDAPDFSTLTD